MDICVIGGRGYVGSAVTARLREDDHHVVTMDPHVGGEHHLSVDILSLDLEDHLDGFNTVINLVGLSPMKQPRGTGYRDLHVAGAENMVGACEKNGIDTLVHMSALGADPDSDILFLETKGMGERHVLSSDLDVTVFRPSVIFDHGNELVEYAKQFASVRTFPRITTPIQPIYRGDMADLFAQAATGEIDDEIMEVGGPDTMSMYTFMKTLYNAQGYQCYPLPILPLMKTGLSVMEYVPFAPWGIDQRRFLAFDNTVNGNDADRYVDLTAFDDWVDTAFD